MATDNCWVSVFPLQTHPEQPPSGLQPDTVVGILQIKSMAAVWAHQWQSSEYFMTLQINKSIYSYHNTETVWEMGKITEK